MQMNDSGKTHIDPKLLFDVTLGSKMQWQRPTLKHISTHKGQQCYLRHQVLLQLCSQTPPLQKTPQLHSPQTGCQYWHRHHHLHHPAVSMLSLRSLSSLPSISLADAVCSKVGAAQLLLKFKQQELSNLLDDTSGIGKPGMKHKSRKDHSAVSLYTAQCQHVGSFCMSC